MNIISTIPETFADGPGIRYAIYVSGCKHYCKGCHNPQSWDFNQGTPIETALPIIIDEIKKNPMLTGVTITGGDPMFSLEGLSILLKSIKENFPEKDIWIFTGFTIEELVEMYNKGDVLIKECLELTDTLVDGKFVMDLKEDVTFRGSSNQRFISSPSSYLPHI